MSIANLFVTNSYDLFCNTITAVNGIMPDGEFDTIKVDNIEEKTLNNGVVFNSDIVATNLVIDNIQENTPLNGVTIVNALFTTAGVDIPSGEEYMINSIPLIREGIIPAVVIVADSNIGTIGPDFRAGIYYKITNQYIELSFWAIITNSTDASFTKFVTLDIGGLGINLDPLFEGTGVFNMAAIVPFTGDTTIWSGNGIAFYNAVNQVQFFGSCFNTPTGSSVVTHRISGWGRFKLL